jgi:aspartate aminotransferase
MAKRRARRVEPGEGLSMEVPHNNNLIEKHVSLNLNVRGMPVSATLGINERCAHLKEQGRRVYRMGLGQSPFPVPRPVVEALKLSAREKDYQPVRGLPELREAVAKFHRDKDDIDAHAEGILVGPGSKELMFLLQLVFYGEIIVPTPCWVSYVPQARIIGRNVQLVPTSFEQGWRITPEQIAHLCERECDMYRPRVLVLNYPANPDGGTYTAGELEAIAEAARRYELIILSDEIYGQLHFKGAHVSLARFYPEQTIVSSGLSKWCGAGGWRLGTFAFPPGLRWLMDAMASVASETYTAVSAPIQFAAVRAFRGGITIERYLWHARRILSTLGRHCHSVLTEAGLRVHPPQGAFYLFVDFTPIADRLAKMGIYDSESMCERLLEDTSVAILPGSAFQRPRRELTARLAYVNFDGAKALAAGETVSIDQPLPPDFLDTYCRSTIVAVDRIARWVRGDAVKTEEPGDEG